MAALGGGSSLVTTGGAAATGGATNPTGGATVSGNTGGNVSTGGGLAGGGTTTGASAGGSITNGGSSSGGATPKSGSSSTGGAVTKGGGSSTGGAVTKGGSSSAGGEASIGGSSTGGGTRGAGGGGNGDVYNPDFVEFYGEDCTVAEPKDANSSTLPDLFATDSGSRISKKSDWRCQRAYLKKVIEKYIHGAKPGKPDTVTGTVSRTAISVHVEHGGKSVDFSVQVSLPSGASGPVPIVIGLGGVSGFGGDANLGETIKAEGVATGTYDHNKVSSESNRSGYFTTIYGNTGASAQIGWAWGISRVMDVLIAEKQAGRNDIIDPTAVGVTGCSRNGKGAFTVGAFDERIALGIPQESGTCGVSALRIVNTAPVGPNGKAAESISAAKSAGPAWFGTVFDSYSSKVNSIPGDMHSLLAMYAPRGLLVLDNSRIGELCSPCQHAASAAGQIVFEALGVGKNVAYHGGNPSDPHDHCAFYKTQVPALQRAIRAHLTKKAAPDGRIEPQPAGTADLNKWITWTAPSLADDVSWNSPPLTSE